jgi:cytochrome P450
VLLAPLRYLERLGYGNQLGVVPFRLATKRAFLVTKPEYIEHVLHTPMPPLSRGPTVQLDHWFTTTVFTAEGHEHDREREFWKALFFDEVPATFLDAAVRYSRRIAEGFEEGVPVDVYSEMKRIRRAIDWHVLTEGDLERDAPELAALLDIGFAAQTALITPLGGAYWRSPLPASRRLRAAKRAVDVRIDELAVARRGGEEGGVLADAIQASETRGILKTDDELRGFVKTLLVANQFDTALAWTWYLLARTPPAEAALHEELDRDLSGHDPDPDDLGRLHYSAAVFKEAMRLLPPAWVLTRGVAEEVVIGGHVIPAGALVVFSQWVTHRDPRIWRDPTSFRPERWLDGEAEQIPRFAYFPQSGGLYGCIGTRVVGAIAPLVIATLARRWRFRGARDVVRPRPKFLLEPSHFTLVPERRAGSGQSGGLEG